jgi:hypothetical protein
MELPIEAAARRSDALTQQLLAGARADKRSMLY